MRGDPSLGADKLVHPKIQGNRFSQGPILRPKETRIVDQSLLASSYLFVSLPTSAVRLQWLSRQSRLIPSFEKPLG